MAPFSTNPAHLDTRGLDALLRATSASASDPDNRRMMALMGEQYLTFTRRRFDRFSKHGGDWKDLADSTKLSRNRGEKHRRSKRFRRDPTSARTTTRGRASQGIPAGPFTILRDKLNSLMTGLTRGQPGNLFKLVEGKIAIDVGYGGQKRHPDGDMRIADIAEVHQTGAGKMPRRQILVEPDPETVQGIVASVTEWLLRVTGSK